MGYGTGVLRAYFAIQFLRGLSVGIAGTASLFIARSTEAHQSILIASRGVGMIVGPLGLSRLLGRAAWSGESQYAATLALVLKGFCDYAAARTSGPLALYFQFFIMGTTMASLDTLLIILVARAVKDNRGTLLSIYDALYGVGAMVAPFIAVSISWRAWDVLAFLDLLIAAMLAGQRTFRGKPNNWKAKVRDMDLNDRTGAPGCPCPWRVVSAGIAFTFLSQVASTTVSAWGFTFAFLDLGMPDVVAALVPSVFYASSTVTRFIVAAISRLILPSALIQASVIVVFVGAIFLRMIVCQLLPLASISQVHTFAILFACVLMGAGCCPHYSFMFISMSKHGFLDARVNGLYATSTNLGIAVGLWLPNLLGLPNVECIASFGLILIAYCRHGDFPWGWEPLASSSGKAAVAA
eukprot:TRINITY_DN14766_c0_g1_i3.p1 TRINITY_DN14766_c0_g1~~TRINITY_DN14766_c0_g1_i3.p1  ORF type:complete len:409 (+),score=27.80 TRINITY_DN14766_c0_g1_i3:80-1306(+)